MPRADVRMALWRFLTALVCTRKLLCFSLLNALKRSPKIRKSISAKRKINRLRLIFRLAQKNQAAFSRGTTGHLILAFTPRHGLAPR